jgi:hypothetical protein
MRTLFYVEAVPFFLTALAVFAIRYTGQASAHGVDLTPRMTKPVMTE